MKIVNVNGVTYLGTLMELEGGGIELRNAMPLNGNSPTKPEVVKYYELGNLGELEDVKFGGQGISYSISNLSDEAVMFCKMADLQMDQAKRVAVRKLENKEFSQSLGKM